MSFLKDVVTLAPDDMKVRFACGPNACGIYNPELVKKYLIADAKDLVFPKDMTAQEIQTYLLKRKEYNSYIAFIIYNQAFSRNKRKLEFLQTKKAQNSLEFLTLVLQNPDYFEDNSAFTMAFYPRKYVHDAAKNKGLTPNQASAMQAVEHFRSYMIEDFRTNKK